MIDLIEGIVMDAQKSGQQIVLIVFCLIETLTIIVSAVAVLISVFIRNICMGRHIL